MMNVSGQNIEFTRRLIEAYNARDVEALVACCDPSVEVHTVIAEIGGGVYHGHDGVRRWQRDVEDAWGEDIHAEPGAYFDLGESTLAFGVWRGRGFQSGMEVAMPIALVTTWRDGLMVYFRSYVQREDALSDLGVSEAELEPIEP
jgi:ketosteroid isomerase-like protein